MYYIGKILQAFGLTVVLVDFVRNFPELMGHRTLIVGILIFISGWIIDRYLLKR